MKNYRFPLICSVALACLTGCSSFSDSNASHSQQTHTGGERVGHETHLFWVTQSNKVVNHAADYVTAENGEHYQTSYQWTDDVVREVSRQGEYIQQGEVVPFETLLRFDTHGDAIYQRYRVDGKVFPLSQKQIEQYRQQARHVLKVTTNDHKQGLGLVQGYWNGQSFASCDGHTYPTLTYNHTVPAAVIERLASTDSYIAFVGKQSQDAVRMDTMLMFEDNNHECVTPMHSSD
ncbi:MAG: DUF1481 domain-containing protein [Vibrio sp.]